MQTRFPKKITIQLPELQREALQTIQDHHPHQDAVRILENLLAQGIYSKLGTIEESSEESGQEVDEAKERVIDLDRVPHSVLLPLEREKRERLALLMRDNPKADPRLFVLHLFEWGLDAFSENLAIVETSSPAEEGAE